jgi:hypothetical protein
MVGFFMISYLNVLWISFLRMMLLSFDSKVCWHTPCIVMSAFLYSCGRIDSSGPTFSEGVEVTFGTFSPRPQKASSPF